jgi:flavin reductase (DIM6/NTAB) family NADH-FMN oxidoreductase RutF
MIKPVLGTELASPQVAEDFRSTMRRLASTVTLLSTSWKGQRFGMTATAVTSVSLSPPSLLAIINQTASIHGPLVESGRFCVNILFRGQSEFCDVFSGELKGEERFRVGRWVDQEGMPYLQEAQANVFCTVDRTMPYGTHSIVIGRVQRSLSRLEISPLLYLDGTVRNMAPEQPASRT